MRAIARTVGVVLILSAARFAYAAGEDAGTAGFTANGGAIGVPAAVTPDREDFGTTSESVVTTWAIDSMQVLGTESVNLMTGTRTCVSTPAPTCSWAAGFEVPTGAEVRGVELSACDGDTTQEIQFYLVRTPKVPGGIVFASP